MPAVDSDPAVLGGQPARGDDRGRPVRWYRDQQVERQLAAREHDAARLDSLGLHADAVRDPALGRAVAPSSPEPARPAFGISIGWSVATESSVRSRSPRPAGSRGGGRRTRTAPAGTDTARRRRGRGPGRPRTPPEPPPRPATPAKSRRRGRARRAGHEVGAESRRRARRRDGRPRSVPPHVSTRAQAASIASISALDELDAVPREHARATGCPRRPSPWPTSSQSLRSPIANCGLRSTSTIS